MTIESYENAPEVIEAMLTAMDVKNNARDLPEPEAREALIGASARLLMALCKTESGARQVHMQIVEREAIISEDERNMSLSDVFTGQVLARVVQWIEENARVPHESDVEIWDAWIVCRKTALGMHAHYSDDEWAGRLAMVDSATVDEFITDMLGALELMEEEAM